MSKQIYSYLRNENKILCNLRDVCDYNLYDVLDLLNSLSNENEKLKKERDYWASKYEEGTETFESNLAEENEQLKEKLDFFKDLAQRTEHEKEDYADKYYNLLKKKFSDDEIRRLYSDLQRREYEKHCNGGTTFTAKVKQEVRY